MIMPSLCEEYNHRVNEILQADFDDDLSRLKAR